MFRGIEMNQPSRTDLQRHKYINHAKANGHCGEEITSYDLRGHDSSRRWTSAGLLIGVALVVACCIWPPCAAKAESAASATAHRQCVVVPRLDSQPLNAGSSS